MAIGDARREAPAVARNREPIRAVLSRVLPARGLVLEIASGTGEHAVHFARAFPDLVWQPSDPDPLMRASIAAWIADAALSNVRPPLDIDACSSDWPLTAADAVLCINMTHISPWETALGLMAGAARLLDEGSPLILYGPYKRDGRHTAPSNAAFDISLRARNPDWGVRDLEEIVAVAAQDGFRLAEVIEMPANNLSIVFRRRVAEAGLECQGARQQHHSDEVEA